MKWTMGQIAVFATHLRGLRLSEPAENTQMYDREVWNMICNIMPLASRQLRALKGETHDFTT